jgi:hypothetical protein
MVTGTGNQRGPHARYDYGNNQYFMVWFDNRSGNYDVYGSRVSSAGSILDGGGLVIDNASGDQKNPRVTERRPADGINNYLVSWIDFRNGSIPDVYGVMADGSGAAIGTDFVVSDGTSDQRAVSTDVDYVRTKKAMAGWIDNRTGTVDVYRALMDQSGGVIGAFPVSGDATGVTGDQRGPAVVYAADGTVDNGFLVLWRDSRGGAGYDLYALKVWP